MNKKHEVFLIKEKGKPLCNK